MIQKVDLLTRNRPFKSFASMQNQLPVSYTAETNWNLTSYQDK